MKRLQQKNYELSLNGAVAAYLGFVPPPVLKDARAAGGERISPNL